MPARNLKIVLYPPVSGEAGRREVELPFEPGETLAVALRRLAAREHAEGGKLAEEDLDRVFLAVAGGRLLKADSPMAEGDLILLVPLMAGG